MQKAGTSGKRYLPHFLVLNLCADGERLTTMHAADAEVHLCLLLTNTAESVTVGARC